MFTDGIVADLGHRCAHGARSADRFFCIVGLSRHENGTNLGSLYVECSLQLSLFYADSNQFSRHHNIDIKKI